MSSNPFFIEVRDGRYCVVRNDNGYVIFDAPTYEAAIKALHEDEDEEFLSGPPVSTAAAFSRELPVA